MAFNAPFYFIPVHDLSIFWAKSGGESVASHTLRVLENLRQLRRRTPSLHLLVSSPGFWSRIALSVVLHDLGKCCQGFQSAVHQNVRFGYRHEVLSCIFVSWILQDSAEDAKAVATSVLTHHKDWAEVDQLYPPAEDGMIDGLEALTSQLTDEFFQVGERIVRELIWPHLIQDWTVPESWTLSVSRPWKPKEPIKTLRSVFELARSFIREVRQNSRTERVIEGTFLRGALILSDHSGSAGENLRSLSGLENPVIARVLLDLGRPDQLYQHQTKASETVGSAVLIAPTGSGKTEASLLWASKQISGKKGEAVVYYLLPYQASLNAMKWRLEKPFGEAAVSLQHSRAAQALYRQLLEKDYSPHKAEQIAKHERNLASLYVKPLRISTPYQLLRGAFQLKGHEALWTAAADALFILDEIHVYETSRLAILLSTLRHLCVNFGGHALIMSATFPTYLLEVVQRLLPGASVVEADAKTHKLFERHQVCLLDHDLLDGRIVELIRVDVSMGLGVLIVATTVGRAQTIWNSLKSKVGCRVELLHGRFHSDDRGLKERLIQEVRGIDSSVPKAAVVLVATQVVEVSLNVDFDVLYSDPAPLEALLQRFGRVNRKRTHLSKVVNVCCKIPDRCPVYDGGLIGKGLAALARFDGQILEEEKVQSMLDEIYSGELGTALIAALNRGIERFSADVLATCRPFESDERIERLFDEMFQGHEVLPKTLKDVYDLKVRESPLLAPGLLIPITEGQFLGLKRRGRITMHDGVFVADCPYSGLGLEINGPASEDGV